MPQNVERVSRGFAVLRDCLAGMIGQEMRTAYRDCWWQAVLSALEEHGRDLPDRGDYGFLIDKLDIANCLRILDKLWGDIFRRKLPRDCRTWARELMGVRNKTAHIGGEDFDEDYAWRALDTMARLSETMDDEASEEIRSLAREVRYGSAAGSVAAGSTSSSSEGIMTQTGNISSWRTIMEPHPDVAEGRYKNAEFMANLAQVAKGEGSFEYRDPVEFFARTYVTEGLKNLLVEALKRVAGLDGEPVIQLKTAFGGGKTHSMLALYHILRGKVPVEKLTGVQPVLDAAGVTQIPKVHIAVLVGTAMDPSKSRRPATLPGITINTMWGEMAAQLAISADRPELYDYVKEADKKGVSPGHEALQELFDACGPCLVLLDEMVAYARKLDGAAGLPAGTYENFLSFVQELTEAAGASQNSLVVASIPESEIETGGEAGRNALAAIEHTFGRMESIWKPVTAGEGFEVVRRRLFLDCKDPEARDKVCEQFSRMYQENPQDFPVYAKEVDYRERMISCYPIHPEVFDHLYDEWSTLEQFQRTRGVLRLMAAVIHELWMSNDSSSMIMPGSLPLDVPTVRNELTRYLPDKWNGVVDSEVDGKQSIPYQKDKNNSRFGSVMASRRLARTIFLGSAPTDRTQAVRGIETSKIRLGVVQPGENIAVFNDALTDLQANLSYLYTSPDGVHYWFDTRPTLKKTMEDRASQISWDDADYEIKNRIKTWRKEEPFAGLHICPASSQDVPDEMSVRMVILPPDKAHIQKSEDSDARKECENILNTRGNAPRIYRNMLVFLAPDQTSIQSLRQEVRRLMAWQSIQRDNVALNLDAAQNQEVDNNIRRCNSAVDDGLKLAYCWVLVPYMDLEVNNHTIYWEEYTIRGGSSTPVSNVRQKLVENEALITQWSPAVLLMELDRLLWRDGNEVQVRKLWEDLCTYCYLPRLSGYGVLEDSILTGIRGEDYFAYAEGIYNGRYKDLKYNEELLRINDTGYVVRLSAAREQINEERQKAENRDQPVSKGLDSNLSSSTYVPSTPPAHGENVETPPVAPTPSKPQNTSFFLSTPLNETRINKDVNSLVQEVINQLSSVDGSNVEITLEVHATLPDGASSSLVRNVTENCQTLNVKEFGFSD